MKHVEELSRIVFTTIAASCDEFRAHFPDPSLSSGLVVWAVEEVSKFAQRLKRVVFASNDFHAMARCVHVAMLFSKITEDKGLALGWKLWTLFSEELLASLQAYAQRYPAILVCSVRACVADSPVLPPSAFATRSRIK